MFARPYKHMHAGSFVDAAFARVTQSADRWHMYATRAARRRYIGTTTTQGSRLGQLVLHMRQGTRRSTAKYSLFYPFLFFDFLFVKGGTFT